MLTTMAVFTAVEHVPKETGLTAKQRAGRVDAAWAEYLASIFNGPRPAGR